MFFASELISGVADRIVISEYLAVYLEMQEGMAALLVGEVPQADELTAFAVHRLVKIKPGIYFSLVAVTSNITCKLITVASYLSIVEALSPPYLFERILPRIRISEILGYYYSIRNAGYYIFFYRKCL